MFEYMIGDVKAIKDNYFVLDNGGIGYKIYTSSFTIQELTEYDTYMVYLYMSIREDDISIFGFLTESELELFKLLLTVSSVGPKAALAMLSTLTVDQIKLAIHQNEVDVLSRAPGIGKKTASRIILEIKDKITVEPGKIGQVTHTTHAEMDMAVDALVNLGYLRKDITYVIGHMDVKNMSLEELIKACIRQLSV